MKYSILIVEDEVEIANLLMRRLNQQEYEMTHAIDGTHAEELLRLQKFDLVYMDIMLPGVDGFTLTQRVRSIHKDTIILMVTALGGEKDHLKGYDLGADDYIAKPFSPKLLAAKIVALLKRREELLPDVTKLPHSISWNKEGKQIFVAEAPLPLTPSEYHIFALLLSTPAKVFSRDEITQHLYDTYLYDIDQRGIDTHIYQIRKKIAMVSDRSVIKTVRSMGYIIDED